MKNARGAGGLGGENERPSLFYVSNTGQEIKSERRRRGATGLLQLRTHVCSHLFFTRPRHTN